MPRDSQTPPRRPVSGDSCAGQGPGERACEVHGLCCPWMAHARAMAPRPGRSPAAVTFATGPTAPLGLGAGSTWARGAAATPRWAPAVEGRCTAWRAGSSLVLAPRVARSCLAQRIAARAGEVHAQRDVHFACPRLAGGGPLTRGAAAAPPPARLGSRLCAGRVSQSPALGVRPPDPVITDGDDWRHVVGWGDARLEVCGEENK